jgi:uncharacterized protein YbaA (DUF1428 family)
MAYIDGFLIVIPKAQLKEYKKIATKAGKIWIKHGALDYVETVGEDLNPNMGKMKQKTFLKLANATASDVVIFSYILYKSKAQRNKVNTTVMKDPVMLKMNCENMMNMKKFSYGGFQTFVNFHKK